MPSTLYYWALAAAVCCFPVRRSSSFVLIHPLLSHLVILPLAGDARSAFSSSTTPTCRFLPFVSRLVPLLPVGVSSRPCSTVHNLVSCRSEYTHIFFFFRFLSNNSRIDLQFCSHGPHCFRFPFSSATLFSLFIVTPVLLCFFEMPMVGRCQLLPLFRRLSISFFVFFLLIPIWGLPPSMATPRTLVSR